MDLSTARLRELVAEGEGRALEFKRGLPGDAKVARSLSAFANTKGGLFLVGVTDRGSFFGAPRPRETMAHLRKVAAHQLEPPLAVEVGITDVDGIRIVWCSVPLSPDRPHAAIGDDGVRALMVRVGASNRRASGATLAALQSGPSRNSPDALERRVLEWVASRARAGGRPDGDATVAAFAQATNVGRQRAKRAFVRLEAAGRLVGHGAGVRRVYSIP
ncbi:MAG TPA: ATP-binding protein [Planctomycetota bacterium]|nr:ATP-binding protein [Planctomycetota bacterium]